MSIFRSTFRLSTFFSIFALAAIGGCGSSSSVTYPDTPVDPNSPSSDALYVGTWQQFGYGLFIDIGTNSVTRYEASAASCLKTHTLTRDEFPANMNWTLTKYDYDSFEAYTNQNTSDVVVLKRIDRLPTSCSTPLSDTPTDVVNHLIAMADEYYAFFDQRDIDWNSIKSQAQAIVHDGMNDEELRTLIGGMLSAFNDAHVIVYFNAIDLLEPEFDFAHIGAFVEQDNFVNRIVNEYSALSSSLSLDDYYIEQITNFFATLDSYMDAPLITRGGVNNDLIQWATINQNIGYIQINELEGFDPPNAGDFVSESANPGPHLAALNIVLDEAVADLQNTSGIILDLRGHSGGTTVLDRAIASRFIDNEFVYGSFYAPGANHVPLILTPHEGSRLSQPLVIITSGFNGSSGEDMIMALKADSDTTQIGEQTLGIFSDQLFLSLPNQWAFTLSNEVWLDANNVSWEAQGLVPDDEFDVYSRTDRQTGTDTAIEKAIALLQ